MVSIMNNLDKRLLPMFKDIMYHEEIDRFLKLSSDYYDNFPYNDDDWY